MQLVKGGVDLVKEFEGCRLEAYLCPAQVWTIGYGRTTGVSSGDKITQHQAEEFLMEELQSFARDVKRLLKIELNPAQFSALVSLAYNVGVGAVSRSRCLKRLHERNWAAMKIEWMDFNKAKGVELPGLTRRRAAELKLFFNGESSSAAPTSSTKPKRKMRIVRGGR